MLRKEKKKCENYLLSMCSALPGSVYMGEDIISCFPEYKFTRIKHHELNPCLREANSTLIYTCPGINPLNPALKLFEKNKPTNSNLFYSIITTKKKRINNLNDTWRGGKSSKIKAQGSSQKEPVSFRGR